MVESFHFNISICKRGKGKSAVASAAYISCENIKNEWDGVTHKYENKKGLLYSEIFLPDHVPIEFKDRKFLWNSVELNEKAINSQLARNFIISLQPSLSLEENKRMLFDFIEENFTSKGMIVDLAIHDGSDEGNNNIHAHIMTTMRPINEKGEWQAKSKKEYLFDEKGNPILTKSGKQKTRKIELTDWNDRGNAEKWRESFARICNMYLEKNGIEKQVDHRSYERQGKDEIPTIHLGASASALERKGIQTDKGNINREIKKHNSLVKAIKEKMVELNSWLSNLIYTFQTKYDEYKETRDEEIENKAELFNLNEYISIYYDLQSEKSKLLNLYASNKKMAVDLNRFAKARIYLQDYKLETIADLQGKISELQSRSSKISKTIKAKTEKIEKLNMCLVYADVVKNNQALYDEYKGKSFFKEDFRKSNQDEIGKYERATKQIISLTGDNKLTPKKWQGEIRSLEKEIEKLNKAKEKIKTEFDQINHIKYSVKTVNEDYGIDLSIEIDKAIKRGEKPSVIAAIKKYQKQEIKDEQYKQREKEKAIKTYKGEER